MKKIPGITAGLHRANVTKAEFTQKDEKMMLEVYLQIKGSNLVLISLYDTEIVEGSIFLQFVESAGLNPECFFPAELVGLEVEIILEPQMASKKKYNLAIVSARCIK